MSARGHWPDFSDDAVLNDWFLENIWRRNSLPSDGRALAQLVEEARLARNEIDVRLVSLGDRKIDAVLFWLGLASGGVGVALLAATPAAIPAAVILYGGGASTLGGFGLGLAGGLRRGMLSEETKQLRERSHDLTRFQEQLNRALFQLQVQRR